jgi:hypothetical protein
MSHNVKGGHGGPQNPGDIDQGAVGGGGPAASGPENPDAAAAALETLALEDQQRSALALAGASDDLLALRDAVEATLLIGTGEHVMMSVDDDPATGIVGVGIGLSDPNQLASGMSAPGQPALTLFTVNPMPQEALMAKVAQSAGTRALSTVPVQQVQVGVVDALSHRARQRPAPGGCSVGHVNVTAGTLGSRAIGTTAPWTNRH